MAQSKKTLEQSLQDAIRRIDDQIAQNRRVLDSQTDGPGGWDRMDTASLCLALVSILGLIVAGAW